MKHPQWLLPALFVSTLLGLVAGWFFGPQLQSIEWIGQLFLNALKMVVIPLVFSSLIVGVTSLGSLKGLGKIGAKTFLYFLVTTGAAVALGLILVNWIQPGVGITLTDTTFR